MTAERVVTGAGPPEEAPRLTARLALGAAGRAVLTSWRWAWRNPLLAFGIGVVTVSLVLAAFGPLLAPYDPQSPTPDIDKPPPSISSVPHLIWDSIQGHRAYPVQWMGTDAAGLDIFSRVIAAPRTDMVIALAALLVSFAIGTMLGLVAGFYRSWATESLMRTSDVVQSFPAFILAMMLVTLGGRSAVNIVLVLGILYTPIYLRLTRSKVLSELGREYVEAARAMGRRENAIAFRHVLPNSLGPSLIQASVTIGWAILLTAGLSFVGAGVRPPTPEWGVMIATSANVIILGEWWPSVFPGIAISITVFGYAIVGNWIEQKFGD